MSGKSDQQQGGRPEKKRQRTADKLAAIAFGLFERDGFDAVTMDRIASEADVVRATLYNHFPVKEALLDHYFHSEFKSGIDSLVGDVRTNSGLEKQLNQLFDAFSEWAASKRAYLPHCLDYNLKVSKRLAERSGPSGLQRVFATLLEQARENSEIPPDADTQSMAEYLEQLYFAATLRWLGSDEPSPKQECRRMLHLFLNGARSANRPSREKTK